MNKSFATALVLVFLLTPCMINAVPVSADSKPTADSWTELAPMNLARSYFGAVTLDGEIYAIGGCDQVATGGSAIMPASSTTGGDVGTNQVYDPATGNWTLEAPMPTPREGFAIAVCQGKIYCIGGTTEEPPYDMWGAVGVNEAYDPATNSWQTKASMPYPVTDLQASVVNGKIYCIGGVNASNVGSTANQVYDPATNTWSLDAPLPTSTFDYASAVCNGSIYVINGMDWYSDYGYDLNQIFNPQNDTWSKGAAPPYGTESWVGPGTDVGAATAGALAPERIYIFGVHTQIYNPATNSWSLGTPIPSSRGGFEAVNVNDQLYVMGGSNFTGDLNGDVATETEFNTTELYTPVGYGTVKPEISILSLDEDQTLNKSSVPLVFTVDKAVNWVGYSLDDQANVTLSGNETIGGVPNGVHTITVYANDTYGNMGASNTIDFTVAAPPAPLFSAESLIITGTIVAIAVCAGLGAYVWKKRNLRT